MSSAPEVDDYIAAAPEWARPVLAAIREIVHRVVPDTGEKISYGIPTFTLDDSYFAYMAGFANHVSIYPVHGLPGLDDEIAPFLSGKGTMRFPLGEPIPFDLIERVVLALSERRRR
jgi:uncharacterized protein YdhG (YjbR/CyaY superfamily)